MPINSNTFRSGHPSTSYDVTCNYAYALIKSLSSYMQLVITRIFRTRTLHHVQVCVSYMYCTYSPLPLIHSHHFFCKQWWISLCIHTLLENSTCMYIPCSFSHSFLVFTYLSLIFVSQCVAMHAFYLTWCTHYYSITIEWQKHRFNKSHSTVELQV